MKNNIKLTVKRSDIQHLTCNRQEVAEAVKNLPTVDFCNARQEEKHLKTQKNVKGNPLNLQIHTKRIKTHTAKALVREYATIFK